MVGGYVEISSKPMPSADEREMRCLIPALVLGTLASCLELEQSIAIRADGSGTHKMTLGLTGRAIEMIERSAPAANPLNGVDPLTVFDNELVDGELNALGMELLSHRTWNERRRRFVEIETGFASIADLRKSPLAGSNAEWVVLPGKGRWEGKLRLIFYPQGRVAWQKARQQLQDMKGQVDPVARSLFERRRKEVKGLDISLHIDVPGEIAWVYNLKKTGPRAASARVTEADIEGPEDLIQLLAPRFEVIFDGRGCTW